MIRTAILVDGAFYRKRAKHYNGEVINADSMQIYKPFTFINF